MSSYDPVASPADRPWKRYVRPAVVVLVTGISLYLLLPSLLSVFSSWRSLQHLTWYWALLALLAEAGSFVCLWQLNRIALHEGSWFTSARRSSPATRSGRSFPGAVRPPLRSRRDAARRGSPGRPGRSVADRRERLQIGTKLALPLLAVPAIAAGARVAQSLAVSAYLGIAVLVLLSSAASSHLPSTGLWPWSDERCNGC